MSALGSSANHKRKRSNALDDNYIEEARGNRRKMSSVAREQRDTASQRELKAKTQDSRKIIQRPSVPEAGPSTQKSTETSPTRSLTISIKDSPDSSPETRWEIGSSEISGSDSDSSEVVNRPQWMYFNETKRLEALAYEAKTRQS